MKDIKLQVPMDKAVRDGLEQKARMLGFDSAQAYIRVWAKSQVDGRTLNFNEDDWGQPSPEAAKRINRWAKEAQRDYEAGANHGHTNTDALLKDLLGNDDPTS